MRRSAVSVIRLLAARASGAHASAAGGAFAQVPQATAGFTSGAAQLLRSGSALQDINDSFNRTIWAQPEARVGAAAPDFTGVAVVDGEFKEIKLSDYLGKFTVLFFYPKDFTFVCPTEIIAFSDRAKDFEAVGCQLIACSTDTEESHLAWIKTPRKRGGLGKMNIPILADTTKDIAARYGVLLEDKGIALRGLFIINPEGVLEQITINNLPVGRSVDEALRLVQAIQFVREHGEVCPADWKPGSKTMVADPDRSMDYFSTVEEAAEEELTPHLKPIASAKEYKAAVVGPGPAVVKFYAPWCGKCKQMAPFVDDLAAKHPGVSFYKLDTTAESLESLSQELGIKVLPAYKLFKGGKEVGPSITGYKKKNLAEAVEGLA